MHELFGFCMATHFPIESHLETGIPPVDLTFTCSRDAATARPAPLPSRWIQEAGPPARFGYLAHVEGEEVLCLPPAFNFFVSADRIFCHLLDDAYETKVEVFLFGAAISYWLEKRGIPTLHAAAAEVDGRAVAFLANDRGGKTSLAVTLMQAGFPLVTDNLLALEHRGPEFVVRPSFPQIRLWPDQAARLIHGPRNFEFVHPEIRKYRIPVGNGIGRFTRQSPPLGRIYLPERYVSRGSDVSIEITPFTPGDALRTLLAQTFLPELLEATPLRAHRLGLLGALARRVGVRRIRFPDGVEHLPRVRDAILADLH